MRTVRKTLMMNTMSTVDSRHMCREAEAAVAGPRRSSRGKSRPGELRAGRGRSSFEARISCYMQLRAAACALASSNTESPHNQQSHLLCAYHSTPAIRRARPSGRHVRLTRHWKLCEGTRSIQVFALPFLLPSSLFLPHPRRDTTRHCTHHPGQDQTTRDMSQLSRAALRSLRVSPSSASTKSAATARAAKPNARTQQTRWASADDAPKRSFKGQLQESISQRLEREKADLRWAAHMRASKDRAWVWAPTIGEPPTDGKKNQKKGADQ